MTMSFDPAAMDAYQRAAARVSELLGEAVTATTTAAGVDLSGLGLIGAEFAGAWAAAASEHAATLTTAGNLIARYHEILGGYSNQVTGIDTAVAADLASTEGQVD